MKRQNIDHTQLLVLSLLAGEDMYGYQMIVELARRSDHTFEMKEGEIAGHPTHSFESLYPPYCPRQ